MSVGDVLERDGDRPAYVQFETRAIPDNAATLREGHHVSKDVDYALITPPYSKDRVEKRVDVWFKQKQVDVTQGRVPERHLRTWKQAYEAWKDGQEEPVNGTSIKEWNILSPAQCKNLLSAGCRTIEDLAHANDEAIRRVGMGGMDLRNKAVAWLQAAKDTSPIILQVTKLQKENDQLKGSLDSLQDQVKLLTMQLDARETNVNQTAYAEAITAADIIETTPAEQYEAMFGKKPHHLMHEKTILKKLQG